MKQVLFSAFGIKIYSYGTMIAIGIIVAVWLLRYRGKKVGYNEEHLLDMSIVGILCGFIGGKLLFIITDFNDLTEGSFNWSDLVGHGLVVYGGIIGGALGIIVFCKRKKWDILKVIDLVVPSVALAQGFGRIGCFLAGCCYGKETNSFLGVKFPDSSFAPSGVKLIPTQLFSSGLDFLLAIFLLWYSRKEREKGRIFALYFILYSIGRFILEFFRGDSRGSVGSLSTSQFISIFIFIIGIILFFKPLLFKPKEKIGG